MFTFVKIEIITYEFREKLTTLKRCTQNCDQHLYVRKIYKNDKLKR